MSATNIAESLSNSAKFERCQVLKEQAIEEENYEFCIQLRDKQREYKGKIISKSELNHLKTRILEKEGDLEISRFLKKIPTSSADYFYSQIRDQFTASTPFDDTQTICYQQSAFEQAIVKLTPAKLLQVKDTLGQQVSSDRKPISEGNYIHALNHSKVLLKELCFIQWIEHQPTMIEEFAKYSQKQIATILAVVEKKFVVFRQKVEEFLNMDEAIQKQVIEKTKFVDFVNFNLSAYWMYSYFCFLLFKKQGVDITKVHAQTKSLLLHRRLISVLQSNILTVVKEVDYLNQYDLEAKIAKGSLLLGKRYDLLDGAVLSKDSQKKLITAMIS